MGVYFEHDDVVLFHGENPSQLLELPDNFVDTIITDPPYGLKFMGKKWDYSVPSIAMWRECLRVLKPGGTALIFAGSRTQHRMAVNVEDAGFILKDCIMWIYGSGFPKATDISKQLDKGHARKQGELRTDGRGASPQKLDNHGQGDTGIGHANGSKQQYHETVPTTPEAIIWNGWKSHGLKPAYEPILVAMKPNDGTYANNALVHGVSGLNIAGSLIGYESEADKKSATPQGKCTSKEIAAIGAEPDAGRDLDRVDFNRPEQKGRFPANIILDEEAGRMLDEQSGVSKFTGGRIGNKNGAYSGIGVVGFTTEHQNGDPGFGDKGGASRFFYCAKASKKERNAGCQGLEEKLYAPSNQAKSELKKGNVDFNAWEGKDFTKRNNNNHIGSNKNNHPTVKPLALMTYLCTLTKTPTGGIVLDPFMGSGTTGVSAKILGRPFIGIDQEESSCEIAKARIIHAG